MQQRTIDKLRKKLTKERKRRSKIQGKLKLSQEQSLQLQEALNAANKENERLETAREAQVLHKTNFTKPLHIPRLEHQQLAQIEEFHVVSSDEFSRENLSPGLVLGACDCTWT